MASRLNAVVCIGGAAGTGKSTFAQQIARTFSVPVAAYSDVLRSDAHTLGIEPSRSNLQALGMRRIEEGWSSFTTALTARLGWPPPRPAVIEGIRHPEALDHCRAAAGALRVLFICLDVDPLIRDDRLASRDGDRVDAATIDSHAVESAIPSLAARADLMLQDGKVEEWLDRAIDLLTDI